MRVFGRGVSDASFLEGVGAHADSRPGVWARDLHFWTPPLRGPLDRLRLGDVLSTKANRRAMPRSNRDTHRIHQPRACSRRLAEHRGDRLLLELDSAEELQALLNDLLEHGHAGSTARRTVSYLRCLIRDCCSNVGIVSKTSRPPRGPARRVGRASLRFVPSPQQIAAVLAVLPLVHRVAVALAVAAGLLESEILGLRRRDILDGALVVRTGGIRGRGGHACDRGESVAAWAWPVLLQYLDTLPPGPEDQLLFPNRSDRSRPRSSFAPVIRRLAARVLGRSAPLSLAACRRLWQRIQIDSGLPSVQVRQSWAFKMVKSDSPHWWGLAQAVADNWKQLCAPPVTLRDGTLTVPRRKPKGCRPGQPENSFESFGRKVPPVPSSCRLFDSPEPPRPAGGVPSQPRSGSEQAATAAASAAGDRHRMGRERPGRDDHLAGYDRRDQDDPGEPSGVVLRELQGLLSELKAGRAEGWAARDVRRLERAMTKVTGRLDGLEAGLREAEQARKRSDLLLAALVAGAGYGVAEANKDELRKITTSLLQRFRRLGDGDEVPSLPWSGG